MATLFTKENLSYHGGYLMFTGSYEGQPVYPDAPNVHPSRIGTGISLFIARFKYSGPITKAIFQKELLNSFTVESYAAKIAEGLAPVEILRDNNKGWYDNVMAKYKAKMGIK